MRKLSVVVALVALLALTSCSEDRDDFYNGSGLLSLSLEPLGEVTPSPDDFSITLSPTGGTPGSNHTWESFGHFPQGSRYIAGDYIVTATFGSENSEGFDTAWFEDRREFHLREGEENRVSLRPVLRSALLRVTILPEVTARFPEFTLSAHTPGGAYIHFAAEEKRPAALRPGDATVSVNPVEGVKLLVPLALSLNSGEVSTLVVGYDSTTECITIGDARVDVSQKVLSAPAPEVKFTGTTPDINLIEFTAPASSLTFSYPEDVTNLRLNLRSPILRACGAPGEINLLAPSPAEMQFLQQAGITVGSGRLDISGLTSLLDYQTGIDPVSIISLVAIDASGRIGGPASVEIHTLPAKIELVTVRPAIMGIDKARVTIAAPLSEADLSKHLAFRSADTPLEIVGIERDASGALYDVTLSLPSGDDNVTVEMLYGGVEMDRFTIERLSPEFSLVTDAFARKCKIRVVAANPSVRNLVVERLHIDTGSAEGISIERDTQASCIILIGLQSARHYSVSYHLTRDERPHEISFVTEHAYALPEGDFEEARESVKLHDVPSGGRYSQTVAAIFNCQNRADLSCYAPMGWANTNAKTCGSGWQQRNTWYMYPSVRTITASVSGGRAVELVSVGFDPSGVEIEPWLQPGEPYTSYSLNIPQVKYRAAGRIFLGSYKFDAATMTETYNEGIDFESRPSALNGYYSFLPAGDDPGERGLVEVELLDAQGASIARGRLLLPMATGFTAFSIPLTYTRFGVKAKRLKVMAASSSAIGDIAFESESVPVSFDPVSATALGSRLLLDNLTFAY